MSNTAYRKDIDGLRAYAVLPVVMYHAVPSAIPGGFLGVDVFFVISGYLITLLLLKEISAGKFSFRDFYKRRLRRLAPAYIAMTGIVLLVSYLVFLPSEYIRYSISAMFSVLAVANLYFANTSNYFDPDAGDNPLYHMWSLSVGEQFYMLFPAVLLLSIKFTPKYVGVIIAAFFSISFYVMLETMKASEGGEYYLPHVRAWQLLAGSILAFAHFKAKQNINKDSVSIWDTACLIGGLFIVIFSFFYISKDDAHPGWITLLPVTGTLLIIQSGRKNNPSRIGRLMLSSSPMVYIGLASYSIYLWHQPIISIFNTINPGEKSSLDITLLVLLSIVSGFISWKFIEKPMRHGRQGFLRVFTIFLGASGVIIIASLVVIKNDGFPDRLSDDAAALTQYNHPNKSISRNCHFSPSQSSPISNNDVCNHAGSPSEPVIAIWGSSHAASLVSGFLEIDNRPPVLQASVSGCHPIISKGLSNPKNYDKCTYAHNFLAKYISNQNDIDVVIYHSRWGTFKEMDQGDRFQEFSRTVNFLLDQGIKVIAVTSSPEYNFSIPDEMARMKMMNKGGNYDSLDLPYASFKERQASANRAFQKLRSHPNLMKVSLDEVFCSTGENGSCRTHEDGNPLYFDDDHLSVEGALLAARHIRAEAKKNGFWEKNK